MFDRTRERIQKLEEDHDNLRKVHAHVEKHKLVYACGATGVGCLAVGVFGGAVFGGETAAKVIPKAKNIMLFGYKSPQTINQETIVNVAARGERGHVIIDAMTGNPVGTSIREAAKNEGMSRRTMQEVLRGVREMAPNGKTYVDLGENLSEQLKIALA